MMTKLSALMLPFAKNARAFSGVSACLMTLQALGMMGVVYSNSQAGITKEWVTRMVGQALNAKKNATRLKVAFSLLSLVELSL